jgi:branched-chain amino acid transport system substrate-binding protein
MRPILIPPHKRLSRRTLLKETGALVAGLGAASSLGRGSVGFVRDAWAAENSPIGTYPEGSAGSSVFVGITVPRTGTYAVQGEDELKGYQLAVEHINSGDALIKKISPKTTKGGCSARK